MNILNIFHCNWHNLETFLPWQGYTDPLQGIRMLQNTVKWNYRFYLSNAIAPRTLLDWQVKLVLGVLNQFVAQSITGWNSDNQITVNLLRNYTSLLYSIPGHLSYFAPLFRDSSHDEQHVNCQEVGNWQIATRWFFSQKKNPSVLTDGQPNTGRIQIRIASTYIVICVSLISYCNN